MFDIYYCGKVVLLLCKGARNVLVPITSWLVFLNSLINFNAPGVVIKLAYFLLQRTVPQRYHICDLTEISKEGCSDLLSSSIYIQLVSRFTKNETESNKYLFSTTQE